MSSWQSTEDARKAQQKADSSLQVAKQVLSQMYFYEGKFGLTLKNIGSSSKPNYKYGFINQRGEEVVPFQFEEATPFSRQDGFARVSMGGRQYLLDTAGVKYLLATSLEELTPETEALDIHDGSYTAFPDSIGSFTKLKVILAYGQGIEKLSASIGNLSALTRLDLRNTQLSALPASIGNLSALTRLDIGFSQLSALPESIGNLSALTSLDISFSQLSALPESIGNLSALTSLSLISTQLRELPESIGNLSALTSLHLHGTPLRELPASIGNLSALTSLDLGFSQLSALPASIGNLSALTSLDIGFSQLSALPASIGNLSALTSLDLINTQLRELPASIGNLSALTSLTLRYTQLSELPESILPVVEKYGIQLEKRSSGNGIHLYQVPLTSIPLKAYAFLDEAELSALAGSVFNTNNVKLPLQIADTLISRQPENISFCTLKSRYATFTKEYAVAILAAEKAVSLAPDSISAYAPMALAYLLSDQYEEAEQIYERWKDSTYSVKSRLRREKQKSLRETFLVDLDRLEKFNISHPDVEKIRALLNEEVEVAVEEE